MNVLPFYRKVQVLDLLVEGLSIRAIERITGVQKKTITRILLDAGKRSELVMRSKFRGLHCTALECDEIWTYCQKKQKRCTPSEKLAGLVGDQYVFVALDRDTKLVPMYLVGKRDDVSTHEFMDELARRVSGRVQITTDAFPAYPSAVDEAFGARAAYAQIQKTYNEETTQEKRFSPASITGAQIRIIQGNPNTARISTSYVERQNLTMRMQMRRFTRLTNAFSKKQENLCAAVSLHFFHYNFMRTHKTLRITPAMEAGLAPRIWTWANLFGESIALAAQVA